MGYLPLLGIWLFRTATCGRHCEAAGRGNPVALIQCFSDRSWEDDMGTPSPDQPHCFRDVAVSLSGGRHPPGACLPSCFALCSSLFHSFLQTHNAHSVIRRPASARFSRRPVSKSCSFLKGVARNRRTKNQKHRAQRLSTESLNSVSCFAPPYVEAPSVWLYKNHCRWLKVRLWGRRNLCRLVRNARHGCRARGWQQGCCSVPVR